MACEIVCGDYSHAFLRRCGWWHVDRHQSADQKSVEADGIVYTVEVKNGSRISGEITATIKIESRRESPIRVSVRTIPECRAELTDKTRGQKCPTTPRGMRYFEGKALSRDVGFEDIRKGQSQTYTVDLAKCYKFQPGDYSWSVIISVDDLDQPGKTLQGKVEGVEFSVVE